MKIEGDTIVFRSINPHFAKEKDGRRPNTVRILSDKETLNVLKLWNSHKLKKIRIELADFKKSDSFERELTDISLTGDSFGKIPVFFSWRHEE